MRTLIVSPSSQNAVVGELKRIVASLPGFPEPAVATFETVEKQGFQTAAQLVVVLLGEDPARGQDFIRRLREQFEGHVLAAGAITDPKVILRSLQIGADVFMDITELEIDFKGALRRLLLRPEVAGPPGNLVAVLSASGGCGASTLAVNLAAVMARSRGKCLLIDLNPSQGDLPTLLDLRPRFTLADVALNEARLDQAMFDKMLVRHPSGIHLLASPPDLADARAVTARGVKHVLSLARKLFAETIVDLEDCFHADQVEVLQQATGILLLCRLDFTSLRNTRRLLDHLARLDIRQNRIRVVVNQHGQANALPVDEAEEALREKLTSFIPYDPKTINAANNTGIPAVVKDPNGRLAKSISELANMDFSKQGESPGLLPAIKHLFGTLAK
jgi:pilus assembly protein CpaE